MTTIYKLTDEHNQTKNETQWGIGWCHEVSGEGELCSSGWLHAYTNPLLAVLLNPVHANFINPHLWVAEGEGSTKSDHGLKVGYTKITTIKRMTLPVITDTQRVAFGILCVLEVYHDPEFVKWANGWLDGSDRSASAADAVYTAAVYTAAYAAADADAAVAAAADAAARAADAAVNAAASAAAADAAAYAAHTADLDLVALAERAMTY